MKALILSAGLGTRLKPITDKIPKPLVNIKDKPLMYFHVQNLYFSGVREILINTHYLSEQIEEFVYKLLLSNTFPDLKIKTVYEKVLLGSAGTLKNNESFFNGDEDFIVVYADNLTDIDYRKMLAFHLEKSGIATIACYHELFPETKGIVLFDNSLQISRFIEKPKPDQIVSHFANAGIYILNKEVFMLLRSITKAPLDFGYDLFPFLLREQKKLFVYKMDEFLLDVGTIESYNKAQTVQLNFKNNERK